MGRSTRVFRRFFPVLALFLLSACNRYAFNGTAYDPPRPAPEIAGTNWDGSAFRLGDLTGKVALIFFGYTSCPDICPMTLAQMQQTVTTLEDRAEDVAVVFVTVDPERDTVERLAAYVPAFNPDFFGVRLAPEELEAVKEAYGVFAEKRYLEETESELDYLVDHTGWIYVVDREGNLRLIFGHDTPAAELSADVANLLGR